MSVTREFPVTDFLDNIMEESSNVPVLDPLSHQDATDFYLSSCDLHCELHIFFCIKCTIQICYKCTKEKHLDHQIIYVAEAGEKVRKVSLGLLADVRTAVSQLEDAITGIRKTSTEIDANVGAAFEELEAFTTRCMAAVRKRQGELLKQIACVYKIKQNNLKLQEEHLLMTKSKILTTAEDLQNEYALGSQKLISVNKCVTAELDRFRLIKLSPADDGHLAFQPEISLLRDITNIGHLEFRPLGIKPTYMNSLPTSSLTPGLGLFRDITNKGYLEFKPSGVKPTYINFLPTSSSTSPQSFSSSSSCEELRFVSSSDDEAKQEKVLTRPKMVSPPSCDDLKLGSFSDNDVQSGKASTLYDASSTAVTKKHQETVSNPCVCPANLTASKNIENASVSYPPEAPRLVFGSRGTLNGQLWRPWGICSDNSGNIIISDRGNNRIQIFDPSGTYVKAFGTTGSDPGYFLGPTGVTAAPNGDIVVADTNNHRIQIFANTGTFISTFGSRGSQSGHFKNPWDVACDSCGNIVVSDSRNFRIQLFTQMGMLLNVFCFPFTENRITLRGICFTPDGDVIVADYNNNCLLAVDKQFKDYRTLGGDVSTTPLLWGPQGVVCDKSGNIVVADSKNYRVKAFNSRGNLLWQLGKTGFLPGAFDRPSGICMTTTGKLAVVDFGNSRVQMW